MSYLIQTLPREPVTLPRLHAVCTKPTEEHPYFQFIWKIAPNKFERREMKVDIHFLNENQYGVMENEGCRYDFRPYNPSELTFYHLGEIAHNHRHLHKRLWVQKVKRKTPQIKKRIFLVKKYIRLKNILRPLRQYFWTKILAI